MRIQSDWRASKSQRAAASRSASLRRANFFDPSFSARDATTEKIC
jgi:hypothetical protein